MKTVACLAAILGLCAQTSHAQSSVTLYGLLDAGLTYTTNQNGHRNIQETTSQIQGDRWGLRGVEDLGGGLSAILTLESGFTLPTGTLAQGGREFGRQAFVGLASNQYGSATFGRQYTSIFDYLGPLSLTGTIAGGTQFAHPFDNDNLNGSLRVDNSVKYTSPRFHGLLVSGMYGFSNAAGDFANNRAYSFATSYIYGGLNLVASYLQFNNTVALTGGVQQISNSNGAIVSDNTFTASRQRTWGAGANYTLGQLTLGLVFTQTLLDNPFAILSSSSGVSGGLSLNGDNARFNNYEANVRYMFTPAWSVSGAYTYTDGKLNGRNPKWNQLSLQTSYLLSKRTDVYIQTEVQQVSEDGLKIGADIFGMSTASNNNRQLGVTVGMRHRF
ncbi:MULTISPECIES: porin [unclassified Caballeronia]|uniref:porin n=1 Tax=unclassified Caballeronia TaxID=2646786 RepID=UPI003ECED397